MSDRVFQTFGQPRLSVVIFLSVVSTVRASSTSDSSIDIGATHDGTTSTCFTTHGGDDTPFLALDFSPISLRVTSIGIKTYSSLGKHNFCKRHIFCCCWRHELNRERGTSTRIWAQSTGVKHNKAKQTKSFWLDGVFFLDDLSSYPGTVWQYTYRSLGAYYVLKMSSF